MSADDPVTARGELVIGARLLECADEAGRAFVDEEGVGAVFATARGLFWQLGEDPPGHLMPWRFVADWHLAEFAWWRAVVTARLEGPIPFHDEPEPMRLVLALTTMRRHARQITDVAAAHRPQVIRWEIVRG